MDERPPEPKVVAAPADEAATVLRPYADEWRNMDELRLRLPLLDPLVFPGE